VACIISVTSPDNPGALCLFIFFISHQHHITNVVSPSLHRKAVTNNMLQIIEAHPNWPVYADVFEHPHSQIASQRPIWSDMTFVDTITQERED